MSAVRWTLGLIVAVAVLSVPLGYYRAGYVHAKRLRVVADGRLVRCGQLPAAGLAEAVQRCGIRCVVNIQEQDDARDPLLPADWLASWRGKETVRESEVCRRLGVRFVQIDGGVLDDPGVPPGGRPQGVDDFLALCDDPANWPVLLHCHAGRDRTGLLVGVYRMEYEERSKAEALRELRANGFATFAATDGNAYVDRHILKFEKGVRRPPSAKVTRLEGGGP